MHNTPSLGWHLTARITAHPIRTHNKTQLIVNREQFATLQMLV